MLVTFSTLYDACFMNSARMLAFPPPEPPEPPGDELQAPRARRPAPAADSLKKSRREVVRTSDMVLPMEPASADLPVPTPATPGPHAQNRTRKFPVASRPNGTSFYRAARVFAVNAPVE